MRPDTPAPVRLEDYRPSAFAIDAVHLDVRLAPQATRVIARLQIRRTARADPATPLVLDGDELELSSLSLDGQPIDAGRYKVSPDALEIDGVPEGPFTLVIETRLNPDANTKLMGLYRSNGTYCTQCEAEGFRRITYFLDRPDCLSVYTTRIEARKGEAPILLANGNPVETGDIAGTDRHYAIWHDPYPKPSYLFAMVAGDLACVPDRFTTADAREVALNIYVEHGNEDKCAWAMDSLKRSMRWDEERFGRVYDLDVFNIVAVSDFNMGAMENKGLNIFNDKYVLADPDTATDQDYAGIEAVIAHEYFHNWTGNRITCRDWFQLCLKEGLTVFRDQEFSADMRSRAVKRISDVRLLKSHQFPEDAGPLAHPVRPRIYHEINNFYTATVYEKGAEVIRMLQTVLGEDAFKRGMDLFFDRHDGEATTVEAFLKCFAEASGRNLAQFSKWYDQAGTPALRIETTYDAEEQRLTLIVKQQMSPTPKQRDKPPMHIPVRVALIGEDGTTVTPSSVQGAEFTGDVLHVRNPSQTVIFSGVTRPVVPSILRGFSAPVTLTSTLSAGEHLFLAAHDDDAFNRWEALQRVLLDTLLKGTEAVADHRTIDLAPALVSAVERIMSDTTLEPAFRALCLHLPGEADIAREIGRCVDPHAVFLARSRLRTTLAGALRSIVRETYDAMAVATPFSPDAEQTGRRSLRAVLLDYLGHGGDADDAKLVHSHFADADNMTDRLAALTTLVHAGLDGSDEALNDFARRHGGTPLAMDKWFMVQATAARASALDTVKQLAGHPGFSLANPNRVRALIGAFATGNQSQFNRADGEGYAFVADMTLALDKRNPQAAARLMSAFRSWRALEPKRRILAEETLSNLSKDQSLSRDLRDIVDRCLQ